MYCPLIRHDYMKTQHTLTNRLRMITIDWLIEVQQEYKCSDQTIHLAINYLDRFLSQAEVERGQLQLLGSTCLFIASKYQEIYPPTPDQFVYISDKTFSQQDLLSVESMVLNTLKFRCTVATTLDFVSCLAFHFKLGRKRFFFACYLLELFNLSEFYGLYAHSLLACAALYVAQRVLVGETEWSNNITTFTGYSLDHLKQVVNQMQQLLFLGYNNLVRHTRYDCGQFSSVPVKYSDVKYECVSRIRPLHYNGITLEQRCNARELGMGAIVCKCKVTCQPVYIGLNRPAK